MGGEYRFRWMNSRRKKKSVTMDCFCSLSLVVTFMQFFEITECAFIWRNFRHLNKLSVRACVHVLTHIHNILRSTKLP